MSMFPFIIFSWGGQMVNRAQRGSSGFLRFNDWKMRNKIVFLVAALALLSVGALTGYAYQSTRQTIIRQTGEYLMGYAEEAVLRSSDQVLGSADAMTGHGPAGFSANFRVTGRGSR